MARYITQNRASRNVVAADESFQSPVLDTGEKLARRFDQAGEHACYSLHPKMTGKLVVG